jgi:hypothetical protein
MEYLISFYIFKHGKDLRTTIKSFHKLYNKFEGSIIMVVSIDIFLMPNGLTLVKTSH